MPVAMHALGIWTIFWAAAASPVPHNQDRPPGPPLTPQQAMGKMQLPKGFTVSLFAAEPDLVNPVAMTFDVRGRVWVAESLEYPRTQAGPGRDRIKILEDSDGDGRADKVSIFADGLNIPSGIALGYGGAFVATPPTCSFSRTPTATAKPILGRSFSLVSAALTLTNCPTI